MTQLGTAHRWTPAEFLRAHDAGEFSGRVELVEGEVWPVVIGDWHGDAVFRVAAALRAADVVVTGSTLPSGDSLPDPDCWVRRSDAQRIGGVGGRLSRWRPADVLLVVEVSDDSLAADLAIKSRVYGTAGYGEYWVVANDRVYVHTLPTIGGYASRAELSRGDVVAIPYADASLAVAELIGDVGESC